jgi:hypothetical protein
MMMNFGTYTNSDIPQAGIFLKIDDVFIIVLLLMLCKQVEATRGRLHHPGNLNIRDLPGDLHMPRQK